MCISTAAELLQGRRRSGKGNIAETGAGLEAAAVGGSQNMRSTVTAKAVERYL